jgi:hypothetical protein
MQSCRPQKIVQSFHLRTHFGEIPAELANEGESHETYLVCIHGFLSGTPIANKSWAIGRIHEWRPGIPDELRQ